MTLASSIIDRILSVAYMGNQERMELLLTVSVRKGINIFLAGFVPTENLRFRKESLTFKESAEEIETSSTMSKTQGSFKLSVVEGEFTDSQIIVMLGENGTGKTTYIRMLAGLLKLDVVERH